MTSKSQSLRAAGFVHEAQWDQFPEDVRAQAIRSVIDLLGCTIAGSRTRAAQLIKEYVLDVYGEGEVPLVGTTSRSTVVGAALVNGFAANALDLDDGHRPARGHPSSAVIPVLLSAAALTEATGKEFLTSVVAGLEVAMRAGSLLSSYYDFYHGTGSWGPIGAAEGAARLLGADVQALSHAIGIAEFHAPITPEMRHVDDPSMLKDGIGWGALVGITSAQLALRGFTGSASLFDEPGTEANVVNSLGKRFLIQDLYFKPYACCRWAQPAIVGALHAAIELDINWAEIKRIRVHTFEAATRLRQEKPKTTEQAQFSLPWTVACALVRGTVDLEEVGEETLGESRRQSLASRVQLICDPELEKLFPQEALAKVEIETYDGRRVTSKTMPAPGDPDNSFTDEQIDEKFKGLSNSVLGTAQAEELLSIIYSLPEATNLDNLFSFLSLSKQ